jgi:hypothetical protein
MTRSVLALGTLTALVSVGCVPVTEPVGDIDKTEVDTNLLGTWQDSVAQVRFAPAPAVKGNPKGLMTMTRLPDPEEKMWFFVSTVGKQKYGNICCTTGDGGFYADFGTAGAYEKWVKEKSRAFLVFQYRFAKNKLVLNFGDEKAFKAIAEGANLPKNRDIFYTAPVGWLAKYLEKNGSAEIYPPDADAKYTRKPGCDQ